MHSFASSLVLSRPFLFINRHSPHDGIYKIGSAISSVPLIQMALCSPKSATA